MKRLSIVIILALVLIFSTLMLCACDFLGGTTNPPNTPSTPSTPTNPQEPTEPSNPGTTTHTHSYQFELTIIDGEFALEGHCSTANCPNPVLIIDEGLTPENVHVEPTCVKEGSDTWTYTTNGKTYTLVVTLQPVDDNHSFSDGVCIYCGDPQPTPPAPHTHSWINATCTTPKTCSTCQATAGEPLGHSWNEATCTTPATCSVCQATGGDALGHSWDNATCTTPKTCSICQAIEGTALGHNWNDATCTAPKTCAVCKITIGDALGHSFEEGICSVCGDTDPDYVAPDGHIHTWTEATCTTPKTCSTCQATAGEPLGHSWDKATCTTPKTCSLCQETTGTALGHSWNDATCTEPKTCSACQVTEGNALGHSWNDATCTAPKTCSACQATTGVALGHNWENATCTAPKTCSACQTTTGVALGHSWSDATCTAPQTCTVCHLTYGDALGHNFSVGVCITCGYPDPDYVAPGAHTHTDNNNDDKCDGCNESVIVIFDFYVINDLHGKFCDTDAQPGVDNLATYLKDRNNYDDNVILLSSGDMWQGAAESNLTNGIILTEWMNEMNFVAMTLGNHEYDWGEDAIRANKAVAEFPFLAINIYDKTTGKLADYCTPSVVVEYDGIQVGIIGAIGDCYSSISADMVTNVEFKVGSELTALVKAESERLRAEGVDLIIYSLHDGYGSSNSSSTSISSSSISSYYDTSLSNGYVDLVFEGHSHQSYTLYDTYNVYHMQGGGENEGITHVEISFNIVTGGKKTREAEVVKSSTYSSLPEDSSTEALEDKYADVIDMAYTVIGKVSTTQKSSTIEDIVAELYLEAGMEKWGDKYNIVLGGGYIKTRSPYDLASGAVTYSDVLSLLPFNNQIALCSISGSALSSKFVNSTNSDYHNAYSTYGSSIKNNINTSATYYVVVDSYTASYAPNKLTVVEYYDDGVYARDLLANEIKAGRFDTSGDITTDSYTLTSIPDIIAKGEALSSGASTAENYYVKGTVKSISSTTYGNMYITDGNGNELLIYGLYDSGGNRYDAMTTKPQVGDIVIICGPILNYKGTTIEIKNGTLISIE
ncbi:MAG: bifunctional metallophosphatase/5'-nucleotidase [Clostridia bacterium]|nr:bifunctional metallophosphatase/5'-nucleotidase [Clostridia bacterium]